MDILSFINNMSWVAALCFLGGFALVAVEMHLPGFGVAGISGTILLLSGIVLTAKSFMDALMLILIILAVFGVLLTIVLQSAAKGKLLKGLILYDSMDKTSGYIGMEDLEYFLNKEGISVTKLRPAGTADFDGVKLDVVTEGEFVDKGTPVVVVKVEGRRIVVRSMS